MYGKEREVQMANSIWFEFLVSLERRVTITPLRQQQPRLSCFVNKQNESLEILSLYFRFLAGSAHKDS